MYNIIFFGPPGAGKGTQAKIVSEYLDIAHLSTGDILRKKLLDKDNLANELREIMSSGKLVSDAILNSIVALRLKNEEKDGYNSVQLGFLDKKERNINKAEAGHFKNANTAPKSNLFEFKNFENELSVGDVLNVDHFIEGEFVDVSGTSKGKGFQGVVKRHGFAGVGDSTHGQHNRMRAPGSIGAGSDPSRVFKGMRMAGQTGNSKVKVLNLKVVKVMSEDNILIVKGSVPGHNNSYITVRK